FMANNKGDGIYETIEDGNYSYMGKPWNWVKNTDDTLGASSNWDSDYTLFGHTSLPFFLRGGCYGDSYHAGVWYIYGNNGGTYHNYGFRPVVFSSAL
ncbi:MAG: hypothetical protein RSF67_08775, partial [Clostridia bacterium]